VYLPEKTLLTKYSIHVWKFLLKKQTIDPNYQLEDIVEMEVTPKDFGRIAAQTAKQVVTQRVREAERGIIYAEFIDREEDIMTGIVQRQDSRFIYVSLGKIEALLPVNEQMPNEQYKPHDRIKVFITKVEKTSRSKFCIVHILAFKTFIRNRSAEIFDGTVEIKSVAAKRRPFKNLRAFR
jgi:N utilization substance protein A